ncbi:MAG TPA: N-acetylneuraminate synthase family protein [Balneolales bacterium]|nr:N-acetylneuraminate synthase family protein [Balneolales bacterium]
MSTYIVGEIGQNHNGSVDLAKKLIDMASMPIIDHFKNRELKPIDAVKLTKRDLDEELSESQKRQPYDNPNSFGKTYGEHRAALELSPEQHFELYKYAKERKLDFVETICSPGALSILKYFKPDRLKVASRDLTNLPLLHALAETKIPIILSTGMGGKEELDQALDIITKHHSDISILHCLSQYPAEYENINLNTIPYLMEQYPDYTIGYSDHSIGIMIPVAAVTLGAKVIEKHITLNRGMKGSDHPGSLEPDGLWRLIRDIRNLELALGKKEMFRSEASEKARVKLERSLAALKKLKKGAVINENDLCLLSPGNGFRWTEREKVIGKKVKTDIDAQEIIYPDMLEDDEA